MAGLPLPPAGWRDVSPSVGDPIAGLNVCLAKSPLSSARFQMPLSGGFTPETLVDDQRQLGRTPAFVVEVSVRTRAERLAGVRQMVDTASFYDPLTELQPLGVRFLHFKVDLTSAAADNNATNTDPTKQPCPIDAESIVAFVTMMRGLVATTERDHAKAAADAEAAPAAAETALKPFIYVHDLYGFNLSGFLLVCFLVEECGLDVISAVNDVADSRPPGIYIASLFQALVNRYFEAEQGEGGEGGIPVIPELPRPDFHQVPWTGVVPTNGEAGANGEAAAGEEKFKRRARKKATPPPPPPPPAAFSPPMASSSAASSSIGVKRPMADGSDDFASKRSRSAEVTNGAHTSPALLQPAVVPSVPSAAIDRVRRLHPFLVPLKPIQVEKLRTTIHTLMPPASVAALKCGKDIWSLLAPPPLTNDVLQQLCRSSAAAPAPYALSWLPTHEPCLLLLQRTEVYAIFGRDAWFHVPRVYFPKRKVPTENVNK